MIKIFIRINSADPRAYSSISEPFSESPDAALVLQLNIHKFYQ